MKFVAYTRVSTKEQGESGLGLQAQLDMISRYVQAQDGKLIAPVFTDVASGKDNNRPELQKALARCKAMQATLVVAKLDRLSRNVAFIMVTHEMLERAGIEFVCVDNPKMNRLMLGIYASFAQEERELISRRTKEALAKSTKALGGMRENSHDLIKFQHLGHEANRVKANEYAERVRDLIVPLRDQGLSLNAIARELSSQEVPTQTGKTNWSPKGVSNVLARLG